MPPGRTKTAAPTIGFAQLSHFPPRPIALRLDAGHRVEALCAAAQRGVDVRILINGPHIDKEVVRRAAQHTYDTLLSGGVRIFEYQRTMLHAKTLLVDGVWASVGSNNVTNRSMALNSELSKS